LKSLATAGRGQVGVEPDEARIEGRHILGQQGLGVALRVDGHEQHLHLVGIRPELRITSTMLSRLVGHTSGHWV
jgi:hypothetical protein